MAPGLSLFPMLLVLAAGPLPEALDTEEVWQYPPYAIIPVAGSVNITCSIRGDLRGVFLRQSFRPKSANVIYYQDGEEPTVDPRFKGRIVFSGPQHNLTITMQRLQPNDTGAYGCLAIMEEEVWGSGTLVVVTAENTSQETQLMHSILPVALAVGFVLVALGLGAMCVLRKTQIKKLCWERDKSSLYVVYEDMSCSRRNTMSTPHHYQ